MPRPSSVWWWEARGRWAFNALGRRHVAPASIAESDYAAAERWHRETLAREYPDRPGPAVSLSPSGRERHEVLLDAATMPRIKRLARGLRRPGKPAPDNGQVIDEAVRLAFAAKEKPPKKSRSSS